MVSARNRALKPPRARHFVHQTIVYVTFRANPRFPAQPGSARPSSRQTVPDCSCPLRALRLLQIATDRARVLQTAPDRLRQAKTAPDRPRQARTVPDRPRSHQKAPDRLQTVPNRFRPLQAALTARSHRKPPGAASQGPFILANLGRCTFCTRVLVFQ